MPWTKANGYRSPQVHMEAQNEMQKPGGCTQMTQNKTLLNLCRPSVWTAVNYLANVSISEALEVTLKYKVYMKMQKYTYLLSETITFCPVI